MRSFARSVGVCGTALSLFVSSTVWAKPYKSGELETTNQYGFGAFEARIYGATGPGVISTFFLWRPGSDTAPAVPWHEIDFEMGLAGADGQTQIMTPGTTPPLYRTEHAAIFDLPSRPWQAYYTYRIEWTPTYIAFFVDGTEIRRETDPSQFGALFDQDASGNTPANERMEIRTGVWPGDPSSGISPWSGVFDGSSVPTGHFVDYLKAWAYTPNQANPFSTLILDEEFNTIDSSQAYMANWTFSFSESDYVPQNIGAKNGFLTVALTTAAGQGILPVPPPENAVIAVPPPTEAAPPPSFMPPPPVTLADGVVIPATSYDAFSVATSSNQGDPSCSTTNVSAETTIDANTASGGVCDVGWTAPGDWLEYDVIAPADAPYDITARIASSDPTMSLHLELDGADVSGPLPGPGLGWQSFVDAVAPDVFLSAGLHAVRVVFDTGLINLHYLAFGASSEVADTPCAGLCTNPVELANASNSAFNLGSGSVCYETTASVSGGVCGNFANGRTLSVNGTTMPCTDANWTALPAARNGGYCIQTTSGDYAWAYFVTW